MTKLHISPDIALPEDVVTSTLVIYGGKGMGKTTLGSVLVEELTKARLRWSLLDPMGVAWGLRHSKDGKGRGVECVLLGGAQGDIPIEPTGGAIVADLVVDENVNTIIDFSRKKSGEMWSIGEKVRFVTEYTHRLFRRQGELVNGQRREPLMQILDEAARYIPQVIPSGAIDLAKCVGAWEQVCEEGRNIGLGVTFLTQRSARMNKSVSELADVMFAFRTVGPNSLAAIMDWLGHHVEKSRVRDLASQVRELDIGQALLVSPGWLKAEQVVRIRDRETFDSSATPKPGQAAKRVTGPAAKPDLGKYEARMAETIEKVKADDPKELRKRITQLERDLASKPVGESAGVIEQSAIHRALELQRRSEERARRQLLDAMTNAASTMMRIGNTLLDDGAKLVAVVEHSADSRAEVQVGHDEAGTREASRQRSSVSSQTTGTNHPADSAVGRRTQAPARPIATPRPSSNGPYARLSPLPAGERSVLISIAQQGSVGADRDQITILSGYKKSTRNEYIRRLQLAGYVEVHGDTVAATTAGFIALGDFERLPTGRALREYWLERLPEGERKVFAAVLEAHPESADRDDLTEVTGYKKSTRNEYIRRLSIRRLVEQTGEGVRANGGLFEGGAR